MVDVCGSQDNFSRALASVRQAPCGPVSQAGAVGRGAPEVAAHIQALVVAVQHVHGAALQPRLPIQLAQQQHGACRACAGRTSAAHFLQTCACRRAVPMASRAGGGDTYEARCYQQYSLLS